MTSYRNQYEFDEVTIQTLNTDGNVDVQSVNQNGKQGKTYILSPKMRNENIINDNTNSEFNSKPKFFSHLSSRTDKNYSKK